MPVQSGEITNILLLLQGQHQCVLVTLAKTVSQFIHICTHIHPAPAHRVSYLHSLVLPCEPSTNFTYTSTHTSSGVDNQANDAHSQPKGCCTATAKPVGVLRSVTGTHIYSGENKYLNPCRFRKFGHLQRNVLSIIVMVGVF